MDLMSVQNVKNKPLIIGLTGGIASGKTTASLYFQSKNIQVIDSDEAVKKLWEENKEMVQKAEALFGFPIATKADKKKISQLIFSDKKYRLKLNEIIHPYVFNYIKDQVEKLSNERFIVVDMPLLFEVNYEKKCDVTCLVFVSEKIQIERLMKRDDISKEEAIKRIESQSSLVEKKMKADIIFDNEGNLDYLHFQIDQFLKGIHYEE